MHEGNDCEERLRFGGGLATIGGDSGERVVALPAFQH